EETGLKPEWAAEAFPDVEEDVRQSLRRIEASPFVTKHESLRGVTTSMSIQFLAPARATDLIAVGRVLRRGKTLVNCDVDV
ncbi:hotdog domain-containing protein, partial [Mycolicibacterium moriokaense]|uniref:hotdog domain-containing protein n=1 Tax=Mycolicibacterium moriokaense TaxID=39691 RepID=UPI002351E093